MKCPKCASENHTDACFCARCGEPLAAEPVIPPESIEMHIEGGVSGYGQAGLGWARPPSCAIWLTTLRLTPFPPASSTSRPTASLWKISCNPSLATSAGGGKWWWGRRLSSPLKQQRVRQCH
jgi:hypothetical protein